MANFIMGIIGLSIGVVVLANVFIANVKSVNSTSFTCYNASAPNTTYACGLTGAESALWGLLAIAGIAGIVFGVLNVFGIA